MPERTFEASPEPVAPLHVMVIDDDPGDLELIRTAFEIVDPAVRVTTVASGQAVQDSWQAAPHSLPDLILLDMHMPGVDGPTVLRWLKSDPALCTIPVVVRSGNESGRDVTQVYRERANAFILKPTGFDGLVMQTRALVTFWKLNRTVHRRVWPD